MNRLYSYAGGIADLDRRKVESGAREAKVESALQVTWAAETMAGKCTLSDSIVEIENNSFNNCSDLVEVNIKESSNLDTIGRNAFSGCHSLESLYIPSHVASIGDSAFNNCGAMRGFVVSEDNETYRSENGHLIQNEGNVFIRGSNNENIPGGIEELSEASFRRSTISRLTIPVSVTFIGNYFIADSNIETIEYEGSQEEWESITKDSMWDFRKENIEINFAA